MPKIISKKDRINNKADKLMICSNRRKHDHCLNHCGHGKYHDKEKGRDSCHLKTEMCTVKGIVKVTCRHLTTQEKKGWVNKEMSK